MNTEDYKEIQNIVDEGIRKIIEESTLPMCKIESARLTNIESVLQKLSILVVGNGHIEDSLLWKQAQTEKSVSKLTEILDRRNADRVASEDRFTILMRYLADKILPSIITSAVIGLIALIYAIQQHLISLP
jgi:hypothetical protein